MKRILHFCTVMALFAAVSLKAQLEPGWMTLESGAGLSLGTNVVYGPAPSPSAGPQLMGGPTPPPMNDADFITPEIQQLADGLMNDPKLIFDYVRNRIKYSHYFGVKKGAHLTMVNGSGNDFDQCALLMALLRASKLTAEYQFGLMPTKFEDAGGNDVKSWLQLKGNVPDQAYNGASWLGNYFRFAGYPKIDGALGYVIYDAGSGNCAWFRVWIRVFKDRNGADVSWFLDPARKMSARVQGVDLSTATALTKDSLMLASGATAQNSHPEFVQSLSSSGVSSALSEGTKQLVSKIRNDLANKTVEEVYGGWRLIEAETSSINSVPFQVVTSWNGNTVDLEHWETIPAPFFSKLSITAGDLTKDYNVAGLRGRKLSLNFPGPSQQLNVWIDDGNLQGTAGVPDAVQSVGTTSGGSQNITVLANEPYGTWNFASKSLVDNSFADQQETKSYSRNGTYVILYNIDPSTRAVSDREKIIARLRKEGIADSDPKLQSEVLNVLGLRWLRETSLASELIGELSGTRVLPAHRVGRAGQEAGYFLDIGLMAKGIISITEFSETEELITRHADAVGGYFLSALEHGIIEQQQGGTAASTMKLLQQANDTGIKVFRADQSNFGSVASQLETTGADAWSQVPPPPSSGGVYFIPAKGKIGLGGSATWRGNAYLLSYPLAFFAKINMINFGGYSGQAGIPSSSWAQSQLPVSGGYATQVPTATKPVFGGDPVDLASGAFTLDSVDLAFGQTEPRGISFSRSYSGARLDQKEIPPLGDRWKHNYECDVSVISDADISLGGGTAEAMAPFVTAVKAALLVYQSDGATSAQWMSTALIANWGVDQLRDKVIAVAMGGRTIRFVQQPYLDGAGKNVFTAEAGLTHSLKVDGSGNYVLADREGQEFRFNAAKKLAKIVDAQGKELNVSYNADGTVQKVEDCWGAAKKTLSFTYSGGRLQSVSDNSFTPARSISFAYSGSQLTAASDPEGKTWTYEYVSSTDSRIVRTKDATARIVVENIYDSQGRVIEQLNEGVATRKWRYHYGGYVTIEEKPRLSPETVGDLVYHYFDARKRSAGTKDGAGNRARLFYDGQDHIVRLEAPDGGVTLMEYDGAHNNTKVTDPLGKTVVLSYDSQNRLLSRTDKRGKTTTFDYDTGTGLIRKIKKIHSPYADGGNGIESVQEFFYNTDGTVSKIKDPEGNETSFEYDSRGNITRTTNPDLSKIENTYTTAGDIATSKNEKGVTTEFKYNKRRQLTESKIKQALSANDVIAAIEYDANGQVWKTTDPKGNFTTQLYTADLRPTKTTLPSVNGQTADIESIYDVRNYFVGVKNPLNQTVSYGYDAAGRRNSVTDPLNRTVAYEFNPNSQVSRQLVAGTQDSRSTYNLRGELVGAIDANNKTITRTHDDAGNQLTLVNRRGNTYRFSYYDDNLPKNTQTPLDYAGSRATTFEYSKRGLLTKVTEPSGQSVLIAYDSRGRSTTRTYKTLAAVVESTVANTYDLAGNVLTTTEGGKTITRIYDDLGRVITYQYSEGAGDPDNYALTYAYDKNGNLTQMTCDAYPGTKTVSYQYDARNRLTQVVDWANRITSFQYDQAGRSTSITRHNGTVREMTYDAVGQIKSILERTSPGVPITLIRLDYDNFGNVQSQFMAPIPAKYEDPRFTTAANAYDADNRLVSFKGIANTYDYDGNMTVGTIGGETSSEEQSRTLTYDTRNRLIGMSTGESFGYDPEGNRISVTAGGQTTRFVVNPAGLSQVLMRKKPDGTKTFYVYGAGLLYEVDSSTNPQYYHYDLRGSTVAITDQTGRVTDRYQYAPHGRLAMHSGASDSPFQFCGQYGVQADQSGLLHMRARYYSPYTCRFINADPTGFGGGMNWYAYTDGNPISLVDPFGLAAQGAGETSWFRQQNDFGEPCIMCHGVSAAGFNGDVNSFSSYLPGSGPNARQGYATLGAVSSLGYNSPEGVMLNMAFGFAGEAVVALRASYLAGTVAAETAALRFTQTTASPWFSAEGKFAGQTISDVAAQLRTGTLRAADVPVTVVGNGLIVNTRSSLALFQAGIPQSQWTLVRGTAQEAADIAARLSRNGLGPTGTDVLRITGSGGNASTLIGSGTIPRPRPRP